MARQLKQTAAAINVAVRDGCDCLHALARCSCVHAQIAMGMPWPSDARRVRKGPRFAARMARCDEQQRAGVEEVVGCRSARRRSLEEIARQAEAAEQRAALRHARRVDRPFTFLGKRIAWPPLSRQKATSGCDSITRCRKLGPRPQQRVDLADLRRRCRKPGSTRRAAAPTSCAPPRLPCDAPRTSARAS